MDWILQKDKDIMSELDWMETRFEIETINGLHINAWGYLDETRDGEIITHLEETDSGWYDEIDTDKIKRWRIIKII